LKKRIKVIFFSVIILCIIGAAFYNYYRGIDVSIYKVKNRTYTKSFKEEGKVVADEKSSIYSLINAQVLSLNVKEGQKVKKGELILKADTKDLDYKIQELKYKIESLENQKLQANTPPYDAQIEAYNLQIENLQNKLDVQSKDFQRIKALYDKGFVSESEYEKAKENVQNLQNMIEQQKNNIQLIQEQSEPSKGTNEYYDAMEQSLKTQIDSLNYEKSKANVYSTMDGVIKNLPVKVGMVLSPGTLIMDIFNDKNYKVETYVLTQDINDIKINSSVDCILKTRDKDLSFKGIVSDIAPAAVQKVSPLGLEEQRIKVTIKPDFKNVTVRPGYDMDVKFTTYKKDNCIFILKSAVFSYKDGKAVWVVRNSKAHIQQVKTGVEDNQYIVIEDGLKEGDVVITDTDVKGLKEGKRVHY
jgi:HlyD family secretion protein